ncbi:MAG TPA: hypothetical protein IAC41_02810 [Candidatus Merdenecus merdavium]|nr:hypothetical protein [Candidatus Merdenecus merdavium]
MKNKLFILGNGFDLAHKLPTRFDPDLKNIAPKYEQYNFWDIYINHVKMIFGLILRICLDIPTLTCSQKSLRDMRQIIYRIEKVIVMALSIRWN